MRSYARSSFVGDDLDGVEVVAEPGPCQLRLLVEQVALGDQHHLVGLTDRSDGVFGAVEQLDGMLEHRTAGRR